MMGATAQAKQAQGTYNLDGQVFFTYTKARNYVLDFIIPLVNKFSPVAGLILLLIERRTVGFHVDRVRLSIKDMMNFTSRSESDVRRARKFLIDLGYLVVIEEGKGLNKTLFRFVLYPSSENVENDVEKPSEEVHTDDNILNLPDPPSSDILSEDQQSSQEASRNLRTVTDHDSGDERGDRNPTIDSNRSLDRDDPSQPSQQTEHEKTASQHGAITFDRPSSSSQVLNITGADPLAPQIPPASLPENADLTAENQTEEPAKPAKSSVSSQTVTVRGAPDLRDQVKTNTGPQIDSDEARKKTVDLVCKLLRSLGAELEPSDYAFVAWCVKEYGIALVDMQIQIMRQQALRGVKFSNPVGRLRSGLKGGYDFCQRDKKNAEGKAQAERRRQISEQESLKWRSHIKSVNETRDDPEKKAAREALVGAMNRQLGITI